MRTLLAKLGIQYSPMRLFPRKRPSMARYEPQDSVQVHKRDFIWRTLVFLVLELAFLALATFCLKNPIPILPSSTSQHILGIAKAITTSIAVIWHTIALFPIKDIISTIFSAECIAQYRRTGHLQPNVTDRVSCITSGLLTQISHFLAPRSTMEYRLAFLLVLLTMALAPLGPSVIGLGPALITHYGHLPIANLTMSKGFLSASQYQCTEKADEIVYFEVANGGTYGYSTPMKQLLIPWPNPGFEESQSIIKYESDVVLYDYDCRWPEFRFNGSQVVIIEITNISWVPWDGYWVRDERYSGDYHWIFPLLDLEDDPPPLSAFVFVNKYLTILDPLGTVKTWAPAPLNSSPTTSSNVTNLPTITFDPDDIEDAGPGPVMAATLLCDPHYKILRAEVTFQDGQLRANLVEQPPLGNFPPSAANSMFSQALLNAFAPSVGVSVLQVSPFTTGLGANQTLLTLPEINNNLNRIIQSAAKAYISGYTGYNGSQLGVFPSYTSFNQTTTIVYPEISLVSSLPFLVALWVVDGVIILILVVLMIIKNAREMWLFSLQAMETIYRDLPTGDEDLTSSQHSPPGADPDTTKPPEFIWHVIVFMVLEVSFLVLAGYCSANPIPVHLPSAISAFHVKSVTTAIVVTWRTLAIFPIKDIILLVFSAECVAQYRRTGDLEPNITDRVSHATSGLMDQTSHFMVGWPTLEYRLAFLLLVFVTLIGPLGPGVLTLSDVPTTYFQELLVANLSSPSVGSELYMRRAQLFVELELLEGRAYSYDTVAEGVLIPWPESGLERSQNVTVYESDIVVYNYSCHWTQVELDDDGILTPNVLPNGASWIVWPGSNALTGTLPSREGIFPLEIGRLGEHIHHNPLFAVAFIGNSTLLDIGGTGTSIRFTPDNNPKVAMFLSVLLCDPRYEVQRANVTLSNGQLRANILPQLPLLGNFPKNGTDDLFSQALVTALSEGDLDRPLLSPISMLLFTGESDRTGPLHPFPLSTINDNMNRVMKSAAKAYLSGYNPSSGVPLSNYSSWSQTATVQYQQTALVASRPFLNGLLALVIVTVIILAVLLKVVHIGKAELFNLQTLEKIYKDEILARDD